MIVRMGLFRRRPELSTVEFEKHWRETHGSLVKKTFGTLEAYVQNLVTDRTQRALPTKEMTSKSMRSRSYSFHR